MQILKYLHINLAEFYLVFFLLLSAYIPPFSFNPLLLALSLIPAIQLILKDRYYGILISLGFIFMNILFLLALFSEYNEVVDFDQDSTELLPLLMVGLFIFGLNSFMIYLMIKKYWIGKQLSRKY